MKREALLPLFDAADAAARAATEPQACTISYDDLSTFVQQEGRYPRITDAKKPWEYRGWLLPYRIDAEVHPDVPKRWDYWARTMLAGKLLDEPIPQISFVHPGERESCAKMLDKWVRTVEETGGGWSAFTMLVDWFMWAFGMDKEPPAQINEKLNEQLYRMVDIGPMLLAPADWLGEWLAARMTSRWNSAGFYPTPHAIVEMMLRMNFPEGGDYRDKTVCDPALGTGRMLLHASNYSLRLYGQDIDRTVTRICKVNGAMYCPWLCSPFPDKFFLKEKPKQ